MAIRNKIYFASDFHLGSFPATSSTKRERTIVDWLNHIKEDALAIYFVGDVFDFWFEYKTVVPRGYIRFLGKLAELADLGIQLKFFKGNHDMWMFGYLKEELHAEIISDEYRLTLNGKSFYIHHGDGLGPGDYKYKTLKKIFRSTFCQKLFGFLHPNLGIAIARLWSKHSRITNNEQEKFLGQDKEWLILYAEEFLKKESIDYFIFGHRHLPYEFNIGENTQIINLGEWINYNSYAVWDGENLTLKTWDSLPEKK